MSFKQDEYQRLHFVPVYVLKRATSIVDEPYLSYYNRSRSRKTLWCTFRDEH